MHMHNTSNLFEFEFSFGEIHRFHHRTKIYTFGIQSYFLFFDTLYFPFDLYLLFYRSTEGTAPQVPQTAADTKPEQELPCSSPREKICS